MKKINGTATIAEAIARQTKSFFWILSIALTVEVAEAGEWQWRAWEGSSFTITSSQRVRFGRYSSWVEKTIPAGTHLCAKALFGVDPIAGTKKQCHVWVESSSEPPPPPADSSSCLLSEPAILTGAARGTVKFFPGHYIHVGQKASETFLAPVMSEISGSQIQGVVKRYAWSDLESEAGEYDLTQIKKDLDYVKSAGKKLIAFVQFKYKGSGGQNIVPVYLRNPADKYYFTLTGGDPGYLSNFGKSYVVDRFLQLMKKIATDLDGHADLAGIMFNETAMGVQGLPISESDAYWKGLLRMDKGTACLFRQTPTFQITNFPEKFLSLMTTAYKNHAIGMSTADVFTHEPTLAGPGASYSFMPGVALQSPIGALVASSNYWHKSHDDFREHDENVSNGLTAPQSVEALSSYIMSKLNPHFVFWTRLHADDSYYKAVMNRAKSSSNPLPALRSVCPSNYICK